MKILKWPIINFLVQFLLVFIIAIIFIMLGNNTNLFGQFLEKYRFIIAIFLGIIMLPMLIKDYKSKNIQNDKLNFKTGLILIIFGISLSAIYNILMFYVIKFLPIDSLYNQNNYILSTLIAVGLIGPIIEEYIFRGIVYNDLKAKFSNIKSILICTALFALFHFSLIQIIYAFAFGLILIYVYEKYKNIKYAIILHISSNIISILIVNVLVINNFTINYVIYLVSLVVFNIIILFHRKNMV